VERFFGLITEKAIRRGSFGNVKELVGRIDHLVDSVQQTPQAICLDCYCQFHPAEARKTFLRISGTRH